MPELLLPGNIISMDARAADRLTACGNGDAALLYLWLLRHGGQLDPAQARKGLKWDGQRLEEASAALVNLGLSDGKTQAEAAPIPAPQGPPDYTAADITREIEDVTSTFPGLVNEVQRRLEEASAALVNLGLSDGKAREEAAPIPAPQGPPDYTAADITREIEDATSTFPGLVNEVQRRLGKVLSTSDLKSLYTLYDYLALPAEVICLLVSWCVEEFERKYGAGQRPRMSQVLKEGFAWKRLGVDTAQAADAHLKRKSLYRTREGAILQLLGLKPRPLVEKEKKKVAAWTDMGFPDEVLRLAYEKTVYKKQQMDWDYMNGILLGWHKKNLHTLAEIEAGDKPARTAQTAGSTGGSRPAMQDHPAAPGEVDRRVREDLERMREFLRQEKERDKEG